MYNEIYYWPCQCPYGVVKTLLMVLPMVSLLANFWPHIVLIPFSDYIICSLSSLAFIYFLISHCAHMDCCDSRRGTTPWAFIELIAAFICTLLFIAVSIIATLNMVKSIQGATDLSDDYYVGWWSATTRFAYDCTTAVYATILAVNLLAMLLSGFLVTMLLVKSKGNPLALRNMIINGKEIIPRPIIPPMIAPPMMVMQPPPPMMIMQPQPMMTMQPPMMMQPQPAPMQQPRMQRPQPPLPPPPSSPPSASVSKALVMKTQSETSSLSSSSSSQKPAPAKRSATAPPRSTSISNSNRVNVGTNVR